MVSGASGASGVSASGAMGHFSPGPWQRAASVGPPQRPQGAKETASGVAVSNDSNVALTKTNRHSYDIHMTFI